RGRGRRAPPAYRPSLPGLLQCLADSRVRNRLTAFVPTHRCGAVPDSHRAPSYDTTVGSQPWRTSAPVIVTSRYVGEPVADAQLWPDAASSAPAPRPPPSSEPHPPKHAAAAPNRDRRGV